MSQRGSYVCALKCRCAVLWACCVLMSERRALRAYGSVYCLCMSGVKRLGKDDRTTQPSASVCLPVSRDVSHRRCVGAAVGAWWGFWRKPARYRYLQSPHIQTPFSVSAASPAQLSRHKVWHLKSKASQSY